MSSFGGLLKDIPGISIDKFCDENECSAVFLLSHCHRDHMEGLNQQFIENLQNTNRNMFCSSMSKKIVEEMKITSRDQSVIQALEINCPTTIRYTFNNEEMSVTVTCIPSGHCPGSVMFVLEKNDKSVLYTGDFRYNVEDMHKMKLFKYFNSCIKKKFNQVLLDATFLSESYPKFPSREESTTEMIRIAQKWLDADEQHSIYIETAYLHGYEYIHKRLAIHFKSKVQVSTDKFGLLCHMGMSDYVTTNNSRICIGSRRKYDDKTLVIKPSAMIWKNCNLKIISMKNDSKSNYYNVCFSTHSSMEELEAFVKHIHFNEIDLIAFPNSCSKMNVLKILYDWSSEREVAEEDLPDEWNFRKKPKKSRKNQLYSFEFLSDDDS